VKELKGEKIGTVEIVRVSSSGRRRYIKLTKELCDAYGIEVGDKLRVKIEEKVTDPTVKVGPASVEEERNEHD